MRRSAIEIELNESRVKLLNAFTDLTDEQLKRSLTPSEHEPDNFWSALDHFAHLALIEQNFEHMIRRQLSGHANPVGLLDDEHGRARTREQIMRDVHAMTDEFQRRHRDDSLSDVIALTGRTRSATLLLLSELSDSQLEAPLTRAPWADGTIGGVIGANADHGRMHWKWIVEAGLLEN